jgi:hypothetical protein
MVVSLTTLTRKSFPRNDGLLMCHKATEHGAELDQENSGVLGNSKLPRAGTPSVEDRMWIETQSRLIFFRRKLR